MPSLFLTRRIHYSGCVQFARGTPKRPLSALARCRAPRRGSVDRTDSSHSTVAAAIAPHAPKAALPGPCSEWLRGGREPSSELGIKRHVWTTPSSKGDLVCCAAVGCGHVSGLRCAA